MSKTITLPRRYVWTASGSVDDHVIGPRANLIIRQTGKTEEEAEKDLCEYLGELFDCEVCIGEPEGD